MERHKKPYGLIIPTLFSVLILVASATGAGLSFASSGEFDPLTLFLVITLLISLGGAIIFGLRLKEHMTEKQETFIDFDTMPDEYVLSGAQFKRLNEEAPPRRFSHTLHKKLMKGMFPWWIILIFGSISALILITGFLFTINTNLDTQGGLRSILALPSPNSIDTKAVIISKKQVNTITGDRYEYEYSFKVSGINETFYGKSYSSNPLFFKEDRADIEYINYRYNYSRIMGARTSPEPLWLYAWMFFLSWIPVFAFPVWHSRRYGSFKNLIINGQLKAAKIKSITYSRLGAANITIEYKDKEKDEIVEKKLFFPPQEEIQHVIKYRHIFKMAVVVLADSSSKSNAYLIEPHISRWLPKKTNKLASKD